MNSQSPLLVFKYCPKCGSSAFSNDTEKSLLCQQCGFRYFINMNSAVAALIRNEKGEILFTIRRFEPAAGMLDLPGGFVDLGETAEEAIHREIYEELHLEISGLEYFGSFTNQYLYGDLEYQTLDIVFNCNVKTLNTLQVADDVAGFVFRNISEIQENEIGLDSIKKIVRELVKIEDKNKDDLKFEDLKI